MKPINIGRMNQRITFHKNADGKDAMGQVVHKLAPYKTVWASIETTTGSESQEAERTRASTTYKIRIRFLFGITQDMKISYKGRWLEIRSINNLYERDRVMELSCVEYSTGGEKDVRT